MSAARSHDLWVACRLPRPQCRLRLFCFPYAGGGVAVFHAWAAELPPEIEVCVMQLPGRERRYREPPIDRMTTLVAELARALKPWLDRPFAFFGHSLGALVAFELVRALRRAQERSPVFFFTAGSKAPQVPEVDAPIHALSDDDFIREVNQRYGGIPAVILQDAELLKLYLPVLRADLAILETYRYQAEPRLAIPISAFGGDQDRRVVRSVIEPWQEQTQGPYRFRMLPGNHFFLQSDRPPLLRALLEDLAVKV